MNRLLLPIIVAALCGCADTGAQKIGKDTYTISVRVPFSGPSGAKGQALKEANQFCASLHREMLLDSENSYECVLHGGCGEAEIHFLCLTEDDPRYVAAHLQKDNGVTTIENR